jgi:hypothetical protein
MFIDLAPSQTNLSYILMKRQFPMNYKQIKTANIQRNWRVLPQALINHWKLYRLHEETFAEQFKVAHGKWSQSTSAK